MFQYGSSITTLYAISDFMGCDYFLELRNYKSINCLKAENGHFQQKYLKKEAKTWAITV